jgi:hypothetical protein
MPLEPGALVTPQLRLVRMFGEGGMGSVWVAEHLTLRRRVGVELITSPPSPPRQPCRPWSKCAESCPST